MVRLLKRFGLAACVAGIAAAYALFLPSTLASVIMPVPFLWIAFHILRHEQSIFGFGRAREGYLPSFVGVTIPIIVLSPIPAVFLMTGVEGLKRAAETPSILAPLLVFVVIAGNATIELLDEGRTVEVKTGDVMRLVAGTRTRWTVPDRIRKIYIASE